MKKIFLFLLIFCVANMAAFAQKITGKVSSNNQPAPFATVLLLNAKDSVLVRGAVTNGEGNYEIENAVAGNYLLRASAVGFADVCSAPFVYDGKDYAAAPIALATANTNLDAVQVTAKRPAFEVKADKMIMNVEGSINATGGNALELLRKAPGVMIDKDDNIALKGKSGVKVYIDGRPSQLEQKDLAALLKSTQSSDIDAIELISNPSAKYDAAGTAGIINIRLKKNKKLGFNGNTEHTIAYGFTPKYNGSLGLNYRDKHWNFFGNYSYHNGPNRSHNDFYRTLNGLVFDQKSVQNETHQNHGFKAGTDYFIDAKNTLGIAVNGNITAENESIKSRTPISAIGDAAPTQVLVAGGISPSQRTNLNYNLNYRFADTSGHELNIAADYGTFVSGSSSHQPNFYKNITETVIFSDNSFGINRHTDIAIKTLKADYETRLAGGKLGVGAKTAWVTTKNLFDYYDEMNDTHTRDADRSNTFNYTENVNAAYVNFNRDFGKKWSLQTGVRAEQTNSQGNLTSTTPTPEDNVKRTYLDFFPSAALTYNASQMHSLNLTYSRRIDRPSYQDLNPFESKLDALAYSRGNAYLRPQYTNSLELTHTFMQFINTTFSASRTTDFFTQITGTKDNATYVRNENLATVDNMGINISAPLPLAKWYNGFLNVGYAHQEYNANFGAGKVVSLKNINSVSFYLQNTVSLPHDWSLELSGWYSSPSIWGGTFLTKSIGNVDFGIQKKILQGNGSLRLAVTDVLATQHWEGVSNFGGTYFVARGGWESQQVRLTFGYRFGNQQLKTVQHRTGNEDEAKRIKGK